ncbi:ABC transporter permease [Anaerococcus porci]|uniref:ABC transporter permease n=1 Tax=Anaerococcus porci TaxID=2652269 RepID=UPI002A75A064|nr:ABC transporter permease [Anaerococcus porci]MDY3005733.1 ABC transporter permease [Anaerococcus porci]
MFLALKEMKKEKGRFILIISIVVLISYLVFFLTSLAYGLSSSDRLAVDLWNGNRVILQKGTNKNILSSVLEKEDIDKFKGHDISPINVLSAVAYKNGDTSENTTYSIFIMGLDKKSKARPSIVEGRDIEDFTKEIVGSKSLKDEEGFKLGDKIRLSQNDKEYEIVGFTEESKFSVRPVFYTSVESASNQAMNYKKEDADTSPQMPHNSPERISGIIVHDDKKIENDNYDIVEINEFIKKLPGYTAQNLTFIMMIGFLIVISSIVLGVFIYIITMQKKQTFAILKIQGISSYYISKSVIFQTLILVFLGVLIGLGLTYISNIFLPAKVPFKVNFTNYLIISLLMITTSLLGAIFSVRAVSKVEALEALE